MGWLRSLMFDAGPSVSTFGKLARLSLAHPDWPAETRPKARSLAALLSKLDRNQELEWLADRPAVCHVLAEVLGTSVATFDRDFHGAIETFDDASGRLRLDDVPFARVIDLGTEALPPGIPDIVLQPPRWQRLLWRAPSGSGRSMVGRWLEARGLATHVEARTLREAMGHIAESGPVFVELAREIDVQAAIDADLRPPICIAGPLGRGSPPGSSESVVTVESPAASSFVEALVDWLEPRLPADGQFEAESATQLLSAWAEDGLCPTLGDLLGLAGLIDEFGVDDVQRRSPALLAARYVAVKLKALGHKAGEARAWHEEALDVLVAMFKRSLTDAQTPWDHPRSAHAWAELVPAELQRTIDPEWLRLTMKAHTTSSTLKELERALTHLPPGGFQVVTTLESAGLLRRVTRAGALSLGPRWLSSWVGRTATRELADASPFEWGEALLEPSLAEALYGHVAERVGIDADALIEDLLELDGRGSPAHVAATECVARAVGLALLRSEIEAPEALVPLWDAAIELVVDVDGTPQPRIAMPTASPTALGGGAYALALLALSEALPRGQGRRHATLRPWLLPPRPGVLHRLFDAIAGALSDRAFVAEYGALATILVGRIPVENDMRPVPERHVLERGPALVAAMARTDASFEEALTVLEDARAAATLPAVAEDAGLDWTALVRTLFEGWRASGYTGTTILVAASTACPPLWERAPRHILEEALSGGHLSPVDVPWACLAAEAWLSLARASGQRLPRAAWRDAPGDAIGRLLAEALPSGEAARELWRARPEAALEHLVGHVDGDPRGVVACVLEAPPAELPAIVERLGQILRSTEQLAAFAPFLHRAVAERVPGWRDAYDLLARIEFSDGRGRSHAR